MDITPWKWHSLHKDHQFLNPLWAPPARSRGFRINGARRSSSRATGWRGGTRRVAHALFNETAVFVHMGATFSKEEELDVIKTGRIHYRDVELKDVSVRFIGSTAIVLSTLQLGSVVDGNEVSNPFVVTEVYVQQAEGWTLASMSFTRVVTHN
ncbi:MAG TPA: nuclear transport factor 2 family protein [Propionibacteriaceae bacterium]